MLYSCCAAGGAVCVCVAAGWQGRASRQGTWGSKRASHTATGPMVTACDRGRQCNAVRRPLRPAWDGVRREVTAGRGPGHHPAVHAIRLGPVRVAASPMLHRGGRFECGSPQQCLLALFLREGWRGRLREARCAQALRGCVVQVLPAVPRGRPQEGEELVQVPVALRSGRIAE